MTILESVGFSQSSQAGQGAKSKWICIFKRKKQRGGRRTPLLTGCFAPVWSVGRQKSSVLCQAPAGPQEQGWEHVVWAQRMRLTCTETSYNMSNLSSSRGDFYYRGMLVLKKWLPKRLLAHAWAISCFCRHPSRAPLSWELVVGSWVGREEAGSSNTAGLTAAVALGLGVCLAFKTARLFLASLWKFQETRVIVLSSREVLFQYVSPCLHRPLVCFFSVVHDGIRIFQNCWLFAHEI